MTTHITKTWFDGTDIVTQEIPVGEAYKREWVGLTDVGRDVLIAAGFDRTTMVIVESLLKEKNT